MLYFCLQVLISYFLRQQPYSVTIPLSECYTLENATAMSHQQLVSCPYCPLSPWGLLADLGTHWLQRMWRVLSHLQGFLSLHPCSPIQDAQTQSSTEKSPCCLLLKTCWVSPSQLGPATAESTEPQDRGSRPAMGPPGKLFSFSQPSFLILKVRAIKTSFRAVLKFWDGQILKVVEIADGQIFYNPLYKYIKTVEITLEMANGKTKRNHPCSPNITISLGFIQFECEEEIFLWRPWKARASLTHRDTWKWTKIEKISCQVTCRW